MHMRRVACLRQGRLADRAEALPGADRVAHGDIRLLGEVGMCVVKPPLWRSTTVVP